jgi:protein-S-isoprenylcysteine O-methyltransferase Ste14
MEVLGKSTINPLFFYSGKIAGFVPIIVALLVFFNVEILAKTRFIGSNYLSLFVFLLSMFFVLMSLFNLGSSTRVGIPTEDTVLKQQGLFKVSRNPIYVGFHLMNVASLLYCFNLYLVILALYSFLVYHFIIKGEEQFLVKRFGQDYLDYKKQVRRYL